MFQRVFFYINQCLGKGKGVRNKNYDKFSQGSVAMGATAGGSVFRSSTAYNKSFLNHRRHIRSVALKE